MVKLIKPVTYSILRIIQVAVIVARCSGEAEHTRHCAFVGRHVFQSIGEAGLAVIQYIPLVSLGLIIRGNSPEYFKPISPVF